MPHVCGDEPQVFLSNGGVHDVCPTYVGMNRHVRHVLHPR